MKRIHEIAQKCKLFFRFLERSDIYTALILVLVGFGGFGLGRLSLTEESRIPPQIRYNFAGVGETFTVSPDSSLDPSPYSLNPSPLVASKNGTKYYYPWCGGVSRISPANLVSFPSEEDAKAKGYTPASNCKGLK